MSNTKAQETLRDVNSDLALAMTTLRQINLRGVDVSVQLTTSGATEAKGHVRTSRELIRVALDILMRVESEFDMADIAISRHAQEEGE